MAMGAAQQHRSCTGPAHPQTASQAAIGPPATDAKAAFCLCVGILFFGGAKDTREPLGSPSHGPHTVACASAAQTFGNATEVIISGAWDCGVEDLLRKGVGHKEG